MPKSKPPGKAAVPESGADDQPALPDFEASIAELDTLVEQLERGDLPLNEALSAYGRGVALARSCQRALDTAEQRVAVLGADGTLEPAEEPSAGREPSADPGKPGQ